MNKPIPRMQPASRRVGRAGDALLSNKVLTLATLLRRSASAVYRRELGLSQSEWRILAILGDRAPLMQADLCEVLGVDKGQLSRSVSALVARQLVTRVADGNDAREVRIELTARGRDAFESLIVLALARNRELVAGLSKDDIATIFAALDLLVDNAKVMLARSRPPVD